MGLAPCRVKRPTDAPAGSHETVLEDVRRPFGVPLWRPSRGSSRRKRTGRETRLEDARLEDQEDERAGDPGLQGELHRPGRADDIGEQPVDDAADEAGDEDLGDPQPDLGSRPADEGV